MGGAGVDAGRGGCLHGHLRPPRAAPHNAIDTPNSPDDDGSPGDNVRAAPYAAGGAPGLLDALASVAAVAAGEDASARAPERDETALGVAHVLASSGAAGRVANSRIPNISCARAEGEACARAEGEADRGTTEPRFTGGWLATRRASNHRTFENMMIAKSLRRSRLLTPPPHVIPVDGTHQMAAARTSSYNATSTAGPHHVRHIRGRHDLSWQKTLLTPLMIVRCLTWSFSSLGSPRPVAERLPVALKAGRHSDGALPRAANRGVHFAAC